MNIKEVESIFKVNHQELMEDPSFRRVLDNEGNVNFYPIKNYLVNKYGTRNSFLETLLKGDISFEIVYPLQSTIKEPTIKLVNVKLLKIVRHWSFVGERGYHYGYDSYYFIIPDGTKLQKKILPSDVVDTNIKYRHQKINDKEGYILVEDNH